MASSLSISLSFIAGNVVEGSKVALYAGVLMYLAKVRAHHVRSRQQLINLFLLNDLSRRTQNFLARKSMPSRW